MRRRRALQALRRLRGVYKYRELVEERKQDNERNKETLCKKVQS